MSKPARFVTLRRHGVTAQEAMPLAELEARLLEAIAARSLGPL